jgi:mannosyltransferase OCH1-like enzyme
MESRRRTGCKKRLIVVTAWLLLGYCVPLYAMPLFVDFNQSMSPSAYYNPWLIYSRADWRLAKRLYDAHIINNFDCSKQPRIPKIIHQIWLGSPLPGKYKKLQQTWREQHSEWQYILWTETEIEQFGLVNQAAYDAATNYGQKSDIARYEILYRMGGLYVDTDFECLQSFDVLHHCCDFFAGIAYGRVVSVYNGLIGAAPGHPILRTCIERIKVGVSHNTSMLGILQSTGPLFFTQCIFDVIDSCTNRCVLFPVSYFYPLPEDQRSNPDMRAWVKPESFAIHYWHMSWVS